MKKQRIIPFSKAINEALHLSMTKDKNVILYGLGVDDPMEIFGTTKGLAKKFGNDRVFDVPTSENAITGVGIGASIGGLIPVMTHQRLDFFLLAMDQLVNAAAKWYFMFGEQRSIPITIRLIIGRGWGQGPTHSQNLQSWFAHIPGLKVVMPSTPQDAKGLLLASIADKNPVVFLEHRWLHNLKGHVDTKFTPIPLGEASVLRKGKDITLVTMSYSTIEAIHAADYLKEHFNIACEIVDLRTVSPIDYNTVFKSIVKTKKVLVLDTGMKNCSISSEIISRITEKFWGRLENKPEQLALPDFPEGTSPALTKEYHVRAEDIIKRVLSMSNITQKKKISLDRQFSHDVPGDWFSGPF